MAVERAKTYHEMYQVLFKSAQDRVKKARENYQLAIERRAAAVHKADEEEINRQVLQQEALNADLGRLTGTLQDLLEKAKANDETLLPLPVGYSIFNDDIIGIRFQEQNENKETFIVTTKITKIYNKSVSVDVRDMRKSPRRDRFEMAVNFTMNFPETSESVVKFMTADQLYANRAGFIGKSGISSTYGLVSSPGIQDVRKTKQKGVVFDMVGMEVVIQEPIAVAADLGAVWKMSSGAFEWIWSRKD